MNSNQLNIPAVLWKPPFVSVLRFCGGLILDIKRKLPFFVSDFTDAFHIQALSAILFIYLGTVTNAITFGGLLGDATESMQVRHINELFFLLWNIYALKDSLTFSSASSGCVGEFSGHSHRRWSLLFAWRPTAHHPQQHRARPGVWTSTLHLQQVRSQSQISQFAKVIFANQSSHTKLVSKYSLLVIVYFLHTEIMTLTTWSFGCGSACGRRSSAWRWWPQTPASWCSTSPASPRKASPVSSASFLSMMPSRRCSS